jgi:hypothetical protein
MGNGSAHGVVERFAGGKRRADACGRGGECLFVGARGGTGVPHRRRKEQEVQPLVQRFVQRLSRGDRRHDQQRGQAAPAIAKPHEPGEHGQPGQDHRAVGNKAVQAIAPQILAE